MAVLGLLGPLVGGLGCESEPAKPAEKPAAATAAPAADPAPEAAPKDDDHYTRRMEIWRDRVTEDPTLAQTARFFEAKTELSEITNNAKDVHLRANATLLLGLLYEGRGDRAGAIGQYEHATKLVKDDAGPYMALALALAAEKRYPEAAKAQKTATKLDPDNLENWLVLGEVLVKSGDQKAGIAAYVDYEKRRKGLIDGLTLKNKQGDYLIGVDERVGCAEALASATDQGTAIALTYAFKSDPSADVRAAVASVMGLQRLTVYEPALQAALPTVKDAGVKEAVAWAMAEIDRDPVTPKRPELPPEVAEAAGTAKAPAEQSADAAQPAAPEAKAG